MIAQVRPSDLPSWIAETGEAERSPILLDVREPWEWRTASVQPKGFELRTIPMNQIPARLHELDRGAPVACLCHHGARSQQVAMFLRYNGFERVANISGGINAWSLEHDPAVPRY